MATSFSLVMVYERENVDVWPLMTRMKKMEVINNIGFDVSQAWKEICSGVGISKYRAEKLRQASNLAQGMGMPHEIADQICQMAPTHTAYEIAKALSSL